MSETLPRLSICIGTFNRANFIGETLESILTQVGPDCEVVISDNASTDETERVVSGYARRFDQVRYIKQEINLGLDRNYDRAVTLARGEYCWLMTDDDVLLPGAVAQVMAALASSPSLVVVNIEFRDVTLRRVYQRSCLSFDSDRRYGPTEMDRLFLDLSEDLRMYIGSLIVSRDVWMMRDRERYIGSLFIHTGTIYQRALPGETLIIARPLISYRLGNVQSWSEGLREVIFEQWPATVESLALSEPAKRRVARARPWRHPSWLLLLRGWGFYSLKEYREWVRPKLSVRMQRVLPLIIALLPASLVNAVLAIYLYLRRDRWLLAMTQSRHNLLVRVRAVWRGLRTAQIFGEPTSQEKDEARG